MRSRDPEAKERQQNIAVRQRGAKALELHASGMSWEQTAQQLHFRSKGAAYRAAMKVLRTVEVETVEQVRAVEDQHLQIVRRRLMTALARADDREVPKIATALTNLSARRGRLLGLDSPTQVEVSGASPEEFSTVAAVMLIAAGRDLPTNIAVSADLDRVNHHLAQMGLEPLTSLGDYHAVRDARMRRQRGMSVVDAEVVTTEDARPAPELPRYVPGADVPQQYTPAAAAGTPEPDEDDPLPMVTAAPLTEDGSAVMPFAEQHDTGAVADAGGGFPGWHPYARPSWETSAQRAV